MDVSSGRQKTDEQCLPLYETTQFPNMDSITSYQLNVSYYKTIFRWTRSGRRPPPNKQIYKPRKKLQDQRKRGPCTRQRPGKSQDRSCAAGRNGQVQMGVGQEAKEPRRLVSYKDWSGT